MDPLTSLLDGFRGDVFSLGVSIGVLIGGQLGRLDATLFFLRLWRDFSSEFRGEG